jgi:hypothetical protein
VRDGDDLAVDGVDVDLGVDEERSKRFTWVVAA